VNGPGGKQDEIYSEPETAEMDQLHMHSNTSTSSAKGDLLAARALEVASAGIVVGPVVFHLYSVALLIRLRVSRFPVSANGRRQAREAWMLDLLFLLSAALCLGIVWVAYLRP
jgi:hypothetical protein